VSQQPGSAFLCRSHHVCIRAGGSCKLVVKHDTFRFVQGKGLAKAYAGKGWWGHESHVSCGSPERVGQRRISEATPLPFSWDIPT
jgi:hypothetical protein